MLALCVFAFAQEPQGAKEAKVSPTPEPVAAPAVAAAAAGPISAGIVVDNSGSFRLVLEFVIKTTQGVAKVVETNDEGFLVRFIDKDKIEILQELTGDKDLLLSATDDMYVEGGLTAISEALMFSAKHLIEKGKNDRKMIILITDGDNRSDKKFHADTLKFLKDNNISVYIVGITTVLDGNLREAQKFLEKLASETGGALVNVDRKMSPDDAAGALVKAVRANSNGK
jgi:hypothetical protein